MLDLALISTPMVSGQKFSRLDGKPMADPFLYRKTIGSLQYLTTTRLNIAYSVNKLSQFLSNPTDIHFQSEFSAILRAHITWDTYHTVPLTSINSFHI